MLDDLPLSLKRELLSFLNRTVLEKVSFFRDSGDNLKDTLASMLKVCELAFSSFVCVW